MEKAEFVVEAAEKEPENKKLQEIKEKMDSKKLSVSAAKKKIEDIQIRKFEQLFKFSYAKFLRLP